MAARFEKACDEAVIYSDSTTLFCIIRQSFPQISCYVARVLLFEGNEILNNVFTILMMRRRLWSLGLAVAFSTFAQCAVPSKAVNVALQASFHSPPYLLELLLVTISLPCPRHKFLLSIEKQQPKKTLRLTFLSLNGSRKDVSLTAPLIGNFTTHSCRWFRKMDTSQTRRFCHPFNLLFLFIQLPRGSRHTISIMIHRWNQI